MRTNEYGSRHMAIAMSSRGLGAMELIPNPKVGREIQEYRDRLGSCAEEELPLRRL